MAQPLMVMAAAGLTGVLTIAYADFSGDVVDVARARTAADAAALAGVGGGRAAADRLAAVNDAVVVSWDDAGHHVTVTVRVGGATARARASNENDANSTTVGP